MARCLLCEKEFVPNDDDEALYKNDYRTVSALSAEKMPGWGNGLGRYSIWPRLRYATSTPRGGSLPAGSIPLGKIPGDHGPRSPAH